MYKERLNTATRDGHNFAILLKSMKSGLHTYEITFQALEEKYSPFLSDDFKREFYKGLQNDK